MEVRLDVPRGSDDQRSAFADEVRRRAAACRASEQAGITDALPLDRNRQWPPSRRQSTADNGVSVFLCVVGPGYFGSWAFPSQPARIRRRTGRSARGYHQRRRPGPRPRQNPIGRPHVTGAEVEVSVVDVRQTTSRLASLSAITRQAGASGTPGSSCGLSAIRKVVPAVRAALVPLGPATAGSADRAWSSAPSHRPARRCEWLLADGALLSCLGIYGVISNTRLAQEIGVRCMASAANHASRCSAGRVEPRRAAWSVRALIVRPALISSAAADTSPAGSARRLPPAPPRFLVVACWLEWSLAAARVEPMSALAATSGSPNPRRAPSRHSEYGIRNGLTGTRRRRVDRLNRARLRSSSP